MGCLRVLRFCRFTTEISVFATEREFGQPLWKLKHKKYRHDYSSLTTQASPLKEASSATLRPILRVYCLELISPLILNYGERTLRGAAEKINSFQVLVYVVITLL